MELGLFLELPVLLAGYILVHSVTAMADFRVFWDTGRTILHGAGSGDFPYPAPAAVALAPFALLPYTLAATIFGLLVIASVPLMLRLLGVRDVRCYGAAFLAGATLSVIVAGALSSLLALGAALAWRYRHNTRIVAVAVAATVVAKIFLWPLLIWLLATRRIRATALSIGAMVVAAVAGWSIVGLNSLVHYPAVVSRMAGTQTTDGYSVLAVANALGISPAAARASAAVVTLLLLGAMVQVARSADGDRRAFSLAIFAALAASPIVWSHYFVLLFVPIALVRPRLSALWFAPLGFWACSIRSGGDLRMIAVATAVTIVVGLETTRVHALHQAVATDG